MIDDQIVKMQVMVCMHVILCYPISKILSVTIGLDPETTLMRKRTLGDSWPNLKLLFCHMWDLDPRPLRFNQVLGTSPQPLGLGRGLLATSRIPNCHKMDYEI